jgi:2-keto-4-pentenoate hydratase/2-oxohepta-3-ene-1,7-dioic acid hydratase in catechol pathway
VALTGGLRFVLSGSLFNARPEEAETAIGGFEVLNDFGARDVQREEMNSGFRPQKTALHDQPDQLSLDTGL